MLSSASAGLPSTSGACGGPRCPAWLWRSRASSASCRADRRRAFASPCRTPPRARARKRNVAAEESGRRRHRIGVLEQLAELARRLHRPEHGHRLLGREALELEEPLKILPRHAGARADEVLDQDLVRDLRVAELERRQRPSPPAFPLGFGHAIQPRRRVGPSGQDLGHVMAVETGDLRCRLLVGRRSGQTAIRPVIGDCRYMRHHIPDRPAGAGRDGGAAPRRRVPSPIPRCVPSSRDKCGRSGQGQRPASGSSFGLARRSLVVGVVVVGFAEPSMRLMFVVFVVFVVPTPPFERLGLRIARR